MFSISAYFILLGHGSAMLILSFGALLSFAEPSVLAFEEHTTMNIERFQPPGPNESMVLNMSFAQIKEKLQKFRVLPDLINKPPKLSIMVQWVEGHFAELGNLIPVDVADCPPYLIDYKSNKTEWFTLIMAGLDEPSREEPSLREYLHWLIVNIPGNRFYDGTELYKYKGPNPAKGTGMHRHGIVVYKQPRELIFDEKSIKSPYFDDPRANFSSYQFAEKYQLGEPVAVNFFQTEWTPIPTLPSSFDLDKEEQSYI